MSFDETRIEWRIERRGQFLYVHLAGRWPDEAQLAQSRRLMLAEGAWMRGVRVLLDLRHVSPESQLSAEDFARWSHAWDEAAGAPSLVAIVTREDGHASAESFVAAAAAHRLPASIKAFVSEAAAARWLAQPE